LNFPPSGSLFDVQNFRRAGFYADTAGYTLAGVCGALGFNQHMEGAGFHAFAAVHALFLVDQVHAVLVFRDRPLLAGFGAFSALHTETDLRFTLFFPDLNAGKAYIVLLVKGLGAGYFTGKAGHTGCFIRNR
jgi:hypothetical protein